MDATVSTVELPSFQPLPDQPTLEGKTKPEANGLRVGSRERRVATLSEDKDIARGEMARPRRRLGTLPREQEIAVEHLLMLTVTKVAD